jgi:NAD(P)-dependent dehydrogenase (short-subunit alcohol dehydrogenase family)
MRNVVLIMARSRTCSSLSGAVSGMGRAAAEKLTAAGHTVIDVDIDDTSVRADMSADAADVVQRIAES